MAKVHKRVRWSSKLKKLKWTRCGVLCSPRNSSVGYGTERDHRTGAVLADVLAPHEDAALKELQQLLAPFAIKRFYTDSWGAYLRWLESQKHTVGKANTQRIER